MNFQDKISWRITPFTYWLKYSKGYLRITGFNNKKCYLYRYPFQRSPTLKIKK